MLALIPAPLQTAGERTFFAELARWDTGAAVRAAVVASLPLVDGPLGRRQSDAVLLVPEGIAVIRVVEVRQAGVVTATPEGSWTIAADGGPDQVLQLVGGGSSPLDGLMRAGMDAAVRLRRAGLEPGRIARLTVLVGDVTGLAPADGDLGEGDYVATLDPRSLLLSFARASRHAGVDNPRLWTTADVRAALEALEYPGRGPSVEELNGEAFPYSPYVLRRPHLLTPAAMAASPVVAPPPDAPVGEPAPPTPYAGDPLSATAVARAVAASVVSANAAAVAAAAPGAAPRALPAQRDTVEVGGVPAPPGGDQGPGGLFGWGQEEPGDPQQDRPQAPPAPTAPSPAAPPPAAPSATASPPTALPPTAVLPASPQPADPPALSPAWGATASGRGAEGSGSRRRAGVLIAALLVLVALSLGGAWLLGGGGPGDGGEDVAPAAPRAAAPAAPTPGDVHVVNGTRYTLQAVQVDDTCAGHAYGAVADFLAATDCVGLSRALYSASVGNAPVVVSVSRVAMGDPATARRLRELTDTDGSGNVSDLLREGVTYAGGPVKLTSAQYASAVSGPTVTVVESSWVDPATAGAPAAVDAVATDGLALPVPAPPGE